MPDSNDPPAHAQAILLARHHAEDDLLRANEALETRTRELAQTLSVMKATLESTADGILVSDVDGRVVTFNQKFLEIWGLPHDLVASGEHADLARRVAHLFDRPETVAERIAAVYGTTESTLDTLQLRDGRWFERFSRPQQVDGRIVGRVWSYRDVTARKHAEEALRDEARVLELLNQTGSAMASQLDLAALVQTVTDAGDPAERRAVRRVLLQRDRRRRRGVPALHAVRRTARGVRAVRPAARTRRCSARPSAAKAPVRLDDVLHDPRYGRWRRTTACRRATCRCAATSPCR